mgnify:CR=1 FL=1
MWIHECGFIKSQESDLMEFSAFISHNTKKKTKLVASEDAGWLCEKKINSVLMMIVKENAIILEKGFCYIWHCLDDVEGNWKSRVCASLALKKLK